MEISPKGPGVSICHCPWQGDTQLRLRNQAERRVSVATEANLARIDGKELPDLLRHIDAYEGAATTQLSMKLMAMTFVRTTELIGARWDEFDLDAGRWDIPAGRMKMKTPHIVPLSVQTANLLKTLHQITGHSVMLFPGELDH
ncbi:MAG: tyrosine-type recombinase/integrase [Burkholderiaceae bacterium]